MQVPNLFRLNARPILIGLMLCCMLDANAATSTTDLTQANQSHLSTDAEQLLSQGKYSDAATRFETLATQASAAQRDHWLLKAARSAQLATNDSKAQSLLDATGKNLNASDTALRALVSAALAIRANQAERAIALLDQLSLPLPGEFASDLLATRMDALFAAGRIVLAVNTAQDRERLLTDSTEINQNRQQLWTGLKQAASTGRDLTPPSGATRTTAGWLELAKLINTSQRDPFGYTRALNDWRTRYPGHPGSSMLSNSIPTQSFSTSGTQRLALLLPLSGKQQTAGIAIRDGFMAAALQQSSGSRASIDVFDTNAKGVLDAYARALQGGANMVIGPLLKEDIETLASSQQVSVTTLALNTLSANDLTGRQPPPGLMFQFALDPEQEARQVAQRAHDEGHSRALVLVPNNDWGQRMQRAFAAELATQGGSLIESRSYDPSSNDYVGLVKQLLASRKSAPARKLDDALAMKRAVADSRDDFDFIFMAAQTAQAKQLRPAIRFVMSDNSIPVYATSDSYAPDSNNTDLDELRFADMPWVINRDSETASLYEQMNRAWGNNLRSRSRLYAFGIDAFKLSSWLSTAQPQLASPLRGATGLLALDQTGRVHRQLDWAQIVNGKPQPLPDVSNIR